MLSFKSPEYYLMLQNNADMLNLPSNKLKYGKAIIENIRELDINRDFHIRFVNEQRYGKGSIALYYPSVSHLNLKEVPFEEVKTAKEKTVTMHIEYFNPTKRFPNTDEPLMGLLSWEQYVDFTVREFTHLADLAIEKGMFESFFQALASQGACFETAIRNIRKWAQIHLDISTNFNKVSDMLNELKNDLTALDFKLDASEPSTNLLTYYASTREPKVAMKKLTPDEISSSCRI